MRRRLAPLALALVVLAVPWHADAAAPTHHGDPSVFAGLGTWFDVYDGPAYRNPTATASRVAARGVKTVYIETANDGSPTDVVNAAQVGAFVDALHAQGLRVVAWYLPGFVKPALDARRTRAMLAFRTAGGGSFDGVGLDIESTSLKSVGMRTSRLLALARMLRSEAPDTPVAAIVYPSRAFERHARLWPAFPWTQLVPLVDAWIPMTYTGSAFKGYDATYGYVARSLRLLREAIGPEPPVHAAGGVANRMSAEELKAFVDAVTDEGTVSGWSLYDWATTPARAWGGLAPLSRG